VRPAVVDGRDLDILVIAAPVELLIFDAEIRKMHLLVEVREVVVVGPFLDLMWFAIWPSIGVVAVDIPLVQPLLILTLELVIEHDAVDVDLALSKPFRFAKVRLVDLRVVFDLAGLYQPRIELLAVLLIAVRAMRVQELATAVREDNDTVSVTVEPLRSDEPLFAQVAQVARARIRRSAVVVSKVAR
jgi:hypothetical protein